MAGITHSAFRRLAADFGGYGALYTEMLSGRAIISENAAESPYTKKRAAEGAVVYQLLLNGSEDIAAIVDRLSALCPAAIDLNLGCPAPEIRKTKAGAMLFSDIKMLDTVLAALRTAWSGPLIVKCRLGNDSDTWQRVFVERLRLFEAAGVDAIVVHPRFFDEKLKRKARWRLFPWIVSQTVLPVIANGDIVSRSDIENHADMFEGVKGFMIGRMAAARPWIFREFAGETVSVDYREVWERLYRYTMEDFEPRKALGRLKEFTAYYSRNFFFGQHLFTAVQNAKSVDAVREAAMEFLSRSPRIVRQPSVSGV